MKIREVGFVDAFYHSIPQLTEDLRQKFLSLFNEFRDAVDEKLIDHIVCVAPREVKDIANTQWFVETVFDSVHIPIEFRHSEDEVRVLWKTGAFGDVTPAKTVAIVHLSGSKLSWFILHPGGPKRGFVLPFSLLDFAHQRTELRTPQDYKILDEQLKLLIDTLSPFRGQDFSLFMAGEDIEMVTESMAETELDPARPWGEQRDQLARVFQQVQPGGSNQPPLNHAVSTAEEVTNMTSALISLVAWLKGQMIAQQVNLPQHSLLEALLLDIVD